MNQIDWRSQQHGYVIPAIIVLVSALNFINILIKNSDVANCRSCSSRDSEVPLMLCSRIVAGVSPVGAVASRWVCEP